MGGGGGEKQNQVSPRAELLNADKSVWDANH